MAKQKINTTTVCGKGIKMRIDVVPTVSVNEVEFGITNPCYTKTEENIIQNPKMRCRFRKIAASHFSS